MASKEKKEVNKTKEKLDIKNIIKNELPSNYFTGIAFSKDINFDNSKITITIYHNYINRFMYENCIYRKPFIDYALEYGLVFNDKTYYYSKEGYPNLFIDQQNKDSLVTITISTSPSSKITKFTNEQYEFLTNAFMKLAQKMHRNLVTSMPNSNNNGYYTSTNAWLTDEGEYFNDEITYASSNEPLEDKYQVEIINTSKIEIPEIDDTLITKDSSQKEPLRQKIDKMFHEKKLCKGISNKYMNDSILEADIIIIIKDEDILLGFTTLKVKDTTFYIDLICSNNEYRKVGTVIMNKIKELGRLIGFTHVTLNSVHSAYNFYTKQKYKITKEQPEKNLVHMKRRLVPKLIEENVGYEGNTNSNNSSTTSTSTNNNRNSNSNNEKKNKKKTNKAKKGGYRKKTKTYKRK